MTRSLMVFAFAIACVRCTSSHPTLCRRCPFDGGPPDAHVEPDGARRPDAVVGCTARTPRVHRAAATECDRVRPPGTSPSALGAPSSCTNDEQCTAGINGRCNGNSHDGWRCTYDACFADAECDRGEICACEGAFRSDANVCLSGNCTTDADCGPNGYCSPSFGSCGAYAGVVGWFCHTCEDECVDDSDCTERQPGAFGDPYCAFDPALARWACSDSQCAG